MKASRRLFRRLTSWTTSARDEEILRAAEPQFQPECYSKAYLPARRAMAADPVQALRAE